MVLAFATRDFQKTLGLFIKTRQHAEQNTQTKHTDKTQQFDS